MNTARAGLGAGVVLAAAMAAGGWYTYRRADHFDYEAAFEPGAAVRAASVADVIALAGKSKDAVRELAGEPRYCERAEFSERCRYGGTGVEITYIDGLADWITVPLSAYELPLAPAALAALGLPQRAPDELRMHEDVWHGLAGFREVRLAGGERGASYARIKVRTR